MESLEKKYREDRLTPKELDELKDQVNSMDDTELGNVLLDNWMNDEIYVVSVEDNDINRVKRQINKAINCPSKARFILTKWIQIAAAFLFVVFIGTTVYLYKENNRLMTQKIEVTTGKGEHASMILPDGTKVALNSESELAYMSSTFNKENRTITFDGEGYFQVAKDKKHPFVIESKGVEVKVLGTKFNLLARKKEPKVELALEEGKVLFLSILTGETVIMNPNQKVIMDRRTGRLKIVNEENILDATAWKRKEMTFCNEPLSFVLQAVGKNYNVKFIVDDKIGLTDLFTGTFPTTNLQEVLDVLKISYHMKVKVSGDRIYLARKNN